MKDLITKRGNSFRVRHLKDGVRTSHSFPTYEEAKLFSLRLREQELFVELKAVSAEIRRLLKAVDK